MFGRALKVSADSGELVSVVSREYLFYQLIVDVSDLLFPFSSLLALQTYLYETGKSRRLSEAENIENTPLRDVFLPLRSFPILPSPSTATTFDALTKRIFLWLSS